MGAEVRCFLVIPLPEDQQQALRGVQEGIEEGAPEFYRWSEPELMHLTLLFLGSVLKDDLDQIADAAAMEWSPMELRMQGLVQLPNPETPKVLAAGIRGDEATLRQQQQRLADRVRHLVAHQEMREYVPHVTLGRLRRGRPARAKAVKRTLATTSIPSTAPFMADGYCLYRSELGEQGPKHTLIRRYGE